MPARPIALLTDFGTGDPYVAAMKGAILTAHPGALIVDVSHDIPRHDVRSAAYVLTCVEGHFPKGTVFVCVVDPGVGTSRPILLLERGGRTILAPGNGLLNLVAGTVPAGRPTGGPPERWYELRSPDRPDRVSPTFHGRDVFAPAAARLARGARAAAIATPVDAPAPEHLFTNAPRTRRSAVRGTVLHVDRFGNAITNIRLPDGYGGRWRARVGRTRVSGPFRTYGEAPEGRPFLLRGSSGLLEISVRRGAASNLPGVKPGATITFRTL